MLCPMCGHPTEEAEKFCRKCGGRLPELQGARRRSREPILAPLLAAISLKRLAWALGAVGVVLAGAWGFRQVRERVRTRAELKAAAEQQASELAIRRQRVDAAAQGALTCPPPFQSVWCGVDPSTVSSTRAPINWDGDGVQDLLVVMERAGLAVVGVASSETGSFEPIWAGAELGGHVTAAAADDVQGAFAAEHSVCYGLAWDAYGPARCEPSAAVADVGTQGVVRVTEPESLACARPGCGTLVVRRVDAGSFRVVPTGAYSGESNAVAAEELRQEGRGRAARIATPTLYVRSGPGRHYRRLTALHAGDRVRVIRAVNVWLLAILPDGSVGWLGRDWVSR